jgi:DNA-directed RNA polymerase sigma subunit (sigma70/sigma32)
VTTKRHQTSTQARTTTRREVLKAIRKADLTREEELVLRMRYGIAEPRSAHLEFRGSDDQEVAAKLAFIEADALAHMRPHPAEPDAEELKRSLIDRLREI